MTTAIFQNGIYKNGLKSNKRQPIGSQGIVQVKESVRRLLRFPILI